MLSTSINQFCSTASEGRSLIWMASRVRFTVCTILSHAPPKCGPDGGMKCQLSVRAYEVCALVRVDLVGGSASSDEVTDGQDARARCHRVRYLNVDRASGQARE
ncbi:uncharacterized protein LOC118468172 [Anopheles albimanus]|uniref:uncharacterized protein LOC118468172 n=1 Tax=Anopheles albimanus TaxID=7167 RepID=UPI00163FE2C4|nr:uncharacterized protein LOC118468172 [Anopheles albimanus]